MWTIYEKQQKNWKIQDTRYSRYIYQKELDKTCLQHGMANEDLNNLPKRTACEKALRGEAFDIAKNPKYDEYQRVLTSTVCKHFDKKASDTNKGTGINSESK